MYKITIQNLYNIQHVEVSSPRLQPSSPTPQQITAHFRTHLRPRCPLPLPSPQQTRSQSRKNPLPSRSHSTNRQGSLSHPQTSPQLGMVARLHSRSKKCISGKTKTNLRRLLCPHNRLHAGHRKRICLNLCRIGLQPTSSGPKPDKRRQQSARTESHLPKHKNLTFRYGPRQPGRTDPNRRLHQNVLR